MTVYGKGVVIASVDEVQEQMVRDYSVAVESVVFVQLLQDLDARPSAFGCSVEDPGLAQIDLNLFSEKRSVCCKDLLDARQVIIELQFAQTHALRNALLVNQRTIDH